MKLIKRAIDITVSTIVIIVLLLPIIMIAIFIVYETRSMPIFRQKRNGLKSNQFFIYKLKTMFENEDSNILQTTFADERITKLGSFLRKWSIDELPQFFNVLIGDMSLIGPRPHALLHDEEFKLKIHGFMKRYEVRPGITGLAQVKGYRGPIISDEDLKKRFYYDIEYINNWSLILDLKIILITPFSIIKNKAF